LALPAKYMMLAAAAGGLMHPSFAIAGHGSNTKTASQR